MSEKRVSMKFNRLRIDRNDGSPVIEYRIENEKVERRNAEASRYSAAAELEWEQLTPEELSSEVLAKSVLAHWLSYRLKENFQ